MGHGIVLVLPNVIVFLALVAEIVPMPARMIASNAAAASYGVRVRMVIVGIGVVNWCGMQIGGVVSTARWGARAQYANRRFTCIGICMIYTHVRYGYRSQGQGG